MQKFFTFFAFLALPIIGFAQDQPVVSIKPTSGSVTAEVNFNPFSSSPVNINYLRFRKFSSATNATRLGVSIGGRFESPSKDINQNTFYLNFRPGFEKHFTGTERFSPYIGFDIDLAFKLSSFNSKVDGDEYKIIGAWGSESQRGFTRFGSNFILGADYYFAKRIYLGTEFGFGFEYVKDATIKVEREFGSNPDDVKGGGAFEIGPNFNSSIRLGFVF